MGVIAESTPAQVFEILVNSQDKVMLEHNFIELRNLDKELDGILQDNGHRNTAFVLKNDDATSYAAYLQVYSALKSAYKHHRNRYCLTKYGEPYSGAKPDIKREIDKEIPIRIAEPNLWFLYRFNWRGPVFTSGIFFV